MNDQVDVLVVGAGPAGLALACDLRRRGVSHRVISAAEGGFEGSRAKGVQPRTLEVLDDLGVMPHLEPRAALYPKLGLHLGPVVVPKTMIKTHEATDDVPYPNTLLVPQYATDTSFRDRLAGLGGQVDFSTRLVAFEEGPDGVVAALEGPGGAETLRARFLVGADGGGSTVRLTAGIDFVGTTDETDRMIIADVTLDGLSRKYWHIWPRTAGRFMALCPLPGGTKFQLSLKVRPEEKADLDLDSLNRRVEAFAGKTKIVLHEIHWASVWRPNIRLAESYRRGRVFLVGDAAHVHPPAGAQGLNTGVQDSYNLGWKLGQVLAGAPDSLLDTYEAERRPVAARVLGLSTEIYASMNGGRLASLTRGDEERQLKLTYAGGPLAPGAGLDAADDVVQAGGRAPDALVVDQDGRSLRLHEAFRGPHFTLVAVGGPAVEALKSVRWPDEGAELKTVAVPEPGEGLKRAYGISGPVQVLVRPDGYVVHVAHDDFAATLVTRAGMMLPARV